ncbi:MAG: 30S ribosomal protein S13 [Candidatus Aenigmarchaeota archaeon]|nr:30S ribosomal protein S13 [Candidatus Aenigmarchaeota archaeon]
MAEKKKERRVIRLFGTDLNPELPVRRALRSIKGVGQMLANAICVNAKIDPNKKMEELSEDELKRIEEIIKNAEFPDWMKNRRKDPVTGENTHIISGDIDLKLREDLSVLKKMRAYRGIRHELGLPVRGQRTGGKGFRKGKTMGVQRKKNKK